MFSNKYLWHQTYDYAFNSNLLHGVSEPMLRLGSPAKVRGSWVPSAF